MSSTGLESMAPSPPAPGSLLLPVLDVSVQYPQDPVFLSLYPPPPARLGGELLELCSIQPRQPDTRDCFSTFSCPLAVPVAASSPFQIAGFHFMP